MQRYDNHEKYSKKVFMRKIRKIQTAEVLFRKTANMLYMTGKTAIRLYS